jgi:hypothetical protein
MPPATAPKLSPKASEAVANEAQIRQSLLKRGITLKVSFPRSGGTVTPHWTLKARNGRSMSFWPATLYYRAPGGKSGHISTLSDLPSVAQAHLYGRQDA